MKSKMKTAFAFAKNIVTTGAIAETCRATEVAVCENIPSDRPIVVVEFGMGHGNITREILGKLAPGSKLYCFEINKEFCDHVAETIIDDRLIIVNDGAQTLKTHVKEPIDYVIGTIPFSFFSKEEGLQIIQNAYDKLVDGGYYCQGLYTKHNYQKFKQIFDDNKIIRTRVVPPEFVYICRKVANKS